MDRFKRKDGKKLHKSEIFISILLILLARASFAQTSAIVDSPMSLSSKECSRLARGLLHRVPDSLQCWRGSSEKSPYLVITSYSEPEETGYVRVFWQKPEGRLAFTTDIEPRVYFKRAYVCHSKQAGAYFKAIDLARRKYLNDSEGLAAGVCQ